jgi:putative aldouronate transport system substrate-binding protein
MEEDMKKMLCIVVSLICFGGMVFGGGNSQAVPASQTTAAKDDGGPLVIHAMLIQYQQPPDPNGKFWKDMEAKYNIKYTADWVQDNTYTDKMALVLSTNSLPDIAQTLSTTDPAIVRAMDAGMFKDLTPHLDFNKYQNLGKISQSAWINSKYKGKNYVFPRSRGQYNDSIMIRGDVVKKYNLGEIKTIDQFTAYLEAMKKEGAIPLAYNVKDNVGRFAPVFGPGNIKPVFTADNTGIVPQQLTESWVKAIDYFRDLYARGLVATEFALFKDAQTENAMLTGKAGVYFKNVWHRYRLNEEIHKVLPNAEITPIFNLEGPGGNAILYDKGFYGGIMVNSKLDDVRFRKLLEFFNKTSDPANYFYFMYGIEGAYWNLVDGFPQLTEEGKKDVNNSFYCPYTLATDMYGKVDSPLAPPAYNRETREMVKVIDTVVAKMGYAPFTFFDIISSKSWSDFWALNKTEYDSLVVDVIAGKRPMSDFTKWQQQTLNTGEVKAAMKEFKQSWDEFGLANWKPPAL